MKPINEFKLLSTVLMWAIIIISWNIAFPKVSAFFFFLHNSIHVTVCIV